MTFWDKEMDALVSEGGRVWEYMDYLRRALPLCDLHSYPFTLFLEFARHADMVRNEAPWLAAVPDTIFLSYVLIPRVNDEDLSGHRPLFYNEIKDRIKGLTVKDAALAVNVWCAEHAEYKAQDARTASPLTVYRSGEGRCGEESAFLVAALRSVGIPARQVYAPWWSHCDDNHAWVEVYIDGTWRFTGACEPEPVLNRGWFNAAASRALYVRSRDFQNHIVVFRNETRRYANTKEYPFQLSAGTRYCVEVLNQAQFRPVVTGTASGEPELLELGQGDFRLTATGDIYPTGAWLDFDFNPPPETAVITPLTQEEERLKKRWLAESAEKRRAWTDSFHDEVRGASFPDMTEILHKALGNFDEIYSFLANGSEPQRKELLRTLRDKDLRDVTAAILEDHLQAALPFRPEYPENVYRQAVLAPRVSNEKLTSWRSVLAESLGPKLLADFKQNPVLAQEWIDRNIAIDADDKQGHLIWTPDVASKSRIINHRSLPVLLTAILRTAGLPARLSPMDGRPEYWNGEAFAAVTAEPEGTLALGKGAGHLIYGVNWSLSRNTNGLWRGLWLKDGWVDDAMALKLRTGRYRIITSVRQNDGGQLASEYYFDITAGKETKVTVRLRETGKSGQGPVTLRFWLDDGGEPTEHIINELITYKQAILSAAAKVHIYVKNAEKPGYAVSALLAGWPELRLESGDTGEWPSYAAARDSRVLLEGSGYRAGVVAAMAAL